MQTRRRFVRNSAIVLGAGAVGVGFTPAPTKAALGSRHCTSKRPMGHKTLVAYASRHGSTADIAHTIAEQLCAKGGNADARWIGDIHAVQDYDAVIIGSAIRYDKWLPEATEFVQTHHSALSNMPVALFLCCLAASSTSEKAARQTHTYAQKVAAQLPTVTPDQVGQFAGVLDYGKMPRTMRLLARGLFAFLGVNEGDYRDWDAIRSWAKAIPALTS